MEKHFILYTFPPDAATTIAEGLQFGVLTISAGGALRGCVLLASVLDSCKQAGEGIGLSGLRCFGLHAESI